jgi:hypothetical protein
MPLLFLMMRTLRNCYSVPTIPFQLNKCSATAVSKSAIPSPVHEFSMISCSSIILRLSVFVGLHIGILLGVLVIY